MYGGVEETIGRLYRVMSELAGDCIRSGDSEDEDDDETTAEHLVTQRICFVLPQHSDRLNHAS